MEELQKQHGAAPLVALSVPLTWIQPNIASYLSNAQSSLFLNHSWEKDFYYIWFPLRCSKTCQTSLLEIFPAIWWDINLSFNWIPLFPGILLFPFTNKFCFLCANSFMSSVSLAKPHWLVQTPIFWGRIPSPLHFCAFLCTRSYWSASFRYPAFPNHTH